MANTAIPEADVERARNLSVSEIAGTFVDLKGRPGREKKGPCPKCGGTDRFSVFSDDRGWMCRKCDKSGDVIDLVMHTFGCDFTQAVERLVGKSFGEVKRRAPAKKPPGYEWHEAEWQTRQRAAMKLATATLDQSDDALVYLALRAIDRRAARLFGIGAARQFHPRLECELDVITVPWLDAQGRITAVKYRAIEPPSDKHRFWQKGGSSQLIFGAHLARGKEKGIGRVVVTEGEFNAMSIYIALNSQTCSVDVLSLGGDTNRSMIGEIAKRYEHMTLWYDDAEKCRRALAELPHGYPARHIVSPVMREKSLDANDILTAHGPEVLASMIHKVSGVT